MAFPLRGWIGEQDADGFTFDVRRFRDACEIGECRIETAEIDRTCADGPGFREARCEPDVWNTRGFLPERKFSPMLFFAEMSTVIA